MPARSEESVPLPSDDETLQFEPCPVDLAFHDDARVMHDFWQCQRPLGHVGRHHAWAIESHAPGFDSEEVEIWWPNPDDPERSLY